MMDSIILNVALKMRLVDNFTVNQKLQRTYPFLGEEEADTYRRECGLVFRCGEEIAEIMRLKKLPPGQKSSTLLLEKFPWLNAENASKVLRRGTYTVWYTAWRNGEDSDNLAAWTLCFVVFMLLLFGLAWWL